LKGRGIRTDAIARDPAAFVSAAEGGEDTGVRGWCERAGTPATGTPARRPLQCVVGQLVQERFRSVISDQDLRKALLGTWRLISYQDVDGMWMAHSSSRSATPYGYLVYMPYGHLFVPLLTCH
jgi:hypothetical protein